MQFAALIWITFKELRVRKLFWINIILSLIFVVFLASFSFDDDGVWFLFGWTHFESTMFSTSSPFYRGTLGAIISNLIVYYYIGYVATLIGLITTAGIVPALIQSGAVDLVVARPITRWRIFIAKYCGSLLYMIIQATLFISLTFLVFGWRWNLWLPGYWVAIPLMVLLFSYLYCLCAAFGLWTRSALASLFLTLACWFFFVIVQIAYDVMHFQYDLRDKTSWRTIASVANTIVPNTGEIPYLVQVAIATDDELQEFNRSALEDAAMTHQERQYALEYEQQRMETPWYRRLLSSVIFNAAIVLLAGWRFTRMDF